MKRFAVFACDYYYPSGGMGDFQKSFDTAQEAKEWVKEEKAKPRYPHLVSSTKKTDDWAKTKFGKFDSYDIADMEEYE